MPRKLSSKHQKIINDVLDEIMAEYAADNKIIFTNESERAKHHFGSLSKSLKDWKKSKQCMVPGCAKQSINKSHAIPRSMSLTAISEKGHLVTPEFDQKEGKMAVKQIGESIASTFPGFCSEHERLFEGFETRKKLETEYHVYLQTYRAACRELFRTKFLIEQHKWLMSSYCSRRDERLRELVQKKAVSRGFPKETVFKSLLLSNDPLVACGNDRISGVQRLSEQIQDKIIPALQNAVFNGNDGMIYVQAHTIDLQIPVALSGCAPFFVADGGIKKEIHLIINVVPCADSSLLICAGDINHKNYIQLYVSNWTENIFSMISMVESWMVNGTDQWYLKPSIWNGLSESRKVAILDAMFKCEQNIGQEYGLSIFDGIRNYLLLMLKEKEESTQDSSYWSFVEAQKAKMM